MTDVIEPKDAAIAMPAEVIGTTGVTYTIRWRMRGAGQNYRATCPDENYFVVKFPFLNDRPYPEAYHREVFALERIVHPNVIPLHDKNPANENKFIVLPYLKGADLADLIESQTYFPQSVAARVLTGVCNGLEATHAQGIIHRDVKPANVLLEQSGIVRLLDYGMCYAQELLEYEDPFASCGSLHYVSPEEIEQKDLEPCADVYSAGIVLFEMLTGKKAHTDPDSDKILHKHLSEDIADPRDYRPDIHPDLAAIVVKATRRDPAARFKSAAAMGHALRDVSEACRKSDEPFRPRRR